jgi:hypothetical protein
MNGNAITETSALHPAMLEVSDGDIDSMVSAPEPKRVAASRKVRGAEPLTSHLANA